LKTNMGFEYSLSGKKIQMLGYCLLIIGLCLTQQVVTGSAESAELPGDLKQEADSTELRDEQKQAKAKKKAEKKPGGQFLPIPIFLTEPAFGYGLGVAVAYIHPTKDDTETQKEPSLHTLKTASSERSGQKPPPTITGVAGGYTRTDTWAVAVGHSTSWRQDTIRYAGALADTSVNFSYYVLDQSFDVNLKGLALYQDLKFRLGKSPFFLGGKLAFLETESQFDITLGEDPGLESDTIEASNHGVAAAATYDSRDNTFTPNSGQLLQFDLWRYDEALGGDYDYWLGNLKLLSFFQLHPRFVLGLRMETSTVDGSAPFYAYPWVTLRGIPAMRYQGESAGEIEVEGRWNIFDRWALVGFAGTGMVKSREISGVNIVKDDIFSGGVGGRYFMMRDLGLWLGVDVAHGPEDGYFYITVGQAW
jgi:hypothetical protein